MWPFTSVTGPTYLRRLDELREIDSPRLCVSIEPLYAAVDITRHLTGERKLAWVVAGFESGDNATPGHPDWARSLRDQCAAHGTAFFWKQWGEFVPMNMGERAPLTVNGKPIRDDADTTMMRVGKKASGRMLDGRLWSQVPALPPVLPA